MSKKKIAIIIGTRPEAIKLIPVYLQCLKSVVYNPILISTGQHLEMLQQVFEYFEIIPDFDLKVMKAENNLSKLTAELFIRIDKVISEIQPDLIMVQGDTSSAWVAAMVGFYTKTTVAHVEAGLRTGDNYNPFPEELYRKQISALADIHFTPTSLATENLTKEGFSNVHQVGNTVVDNLYYCLNRIQTDQNEYAERKNRLKSYSSKVVLVTCHRRENISKIEQIASAIRELSNRYTELSFILPLHLNPKVRSAFNNNLQAASNVFLVNPLPYDEFVFLLSKCYLVLTDSGGVQEEAASCNVPLIVLREVTERDEAIEAGCAIIAGTTANSIVTAFESIHKQRDRYVQMQNAVSPFGDGKSSNKILEILEKDSFLKQLSTVRTEGEIQLFKTTNLPGG